MGGWVRRASTAALMRKSVRRPEARPWVAPARMSVRRPDARRRVGARRARGTEAGQAAVELVGALPALLIVAAVVMQLLAIGYTAVLAGDAAEAGALALARGRAADMAARSAIPGWARAGMEVRRTVSAVNVQMRPPHLVPWIGGLLRVRASAAVAAPGLTGLLP